MLFSSLFGLEISLSLLLLVPVVGRDFYAPANRVATFLIDIFSAKSAVTIFSRIARKYAFISFDYKIIFYCYLLYCVTAEVAVNIAQFAGY